MIPLPVRKNRRIWSSGQISDRGSYVPSPDGKRIGVLKAPGAVDAAPITKVQFIFNFIDQIRAKISATAIK